jgi:hypothetical protein
MGMLKVYKVKGSARDGEKAAVSVRGSLDINFDELKDRLPDTEPMDPSHYELVESVIAKQIATAITVDKLTILKCYHGGITVDTGLTIEFTETDRAALQDKIVEAHEGEPA